MANYSEDIKKLKELIGKKIVNVKPDLSWDDQISGVEIFFEDGTKVEFNSGSSMGCPECDPDGCNTNPLSMYFGKVK
jgi:hypothetical protein